MKVLFSNAGEDKVHPTVKVMKKGKMKVLDSPVDLTGLKVDTYAVAGITDHIVPWANAYRGVRKLGGHVRFVLSTSGHIQALVNPPGPESKSSYRVSETLPDSPDEFVSSVPTSGGSWWPDYAAWLADRSGPRRKARKENPKQQEMPKKRSQTKNTLTTEGQNPTTT